MTVIRGGESLIDSQSLKEAPSVLGGEEGPSIGVVDFGDPVVLPYIGYVELGQVLGRCPSGGGNKVSHFGESVHDYIDGVISL